MACNQHRIRACFLAWLSGSDKDERSILPQPWHGYEIKINKHILWFFTTQSTHKHVVPVGCLYPRGGPCPYCNCCENESSRPSLCPPGNWRTHVDRSAIQLWSAATGTSLVLLQFQMKQESSKELFLFESPRPCLRTMLSVNLRFYCNHLVCKWSELWFSRLSQIFPWYLKATGKQVFPMDCASIKLKYSHHEKFHLIFFQGVYDDFHSLKLQGYWVQAVSHWCLFCSFGYCEYY